MSHSASSQNGGRLEQASYIVHIYYLPVTLNKPLFISRILLWALIQESVRPWRPNHLRLPLPVAVATVQ